MENSNEENEQNYDIKINFYEEYIDLSINSDYNTFIKNICNILKISPEQLNIFTLSYNDEDGDNILLTTEEDYKIFFYQVKGKLVDRIIIEKNENQIMKSNSKEEKKYSKKSIENKNNINQINFDYNDIDNNYNDINKNDIDNNNNYNNYNDKFNDNN